MSSPDAVGGNTGGDESFLVSLGLPAGLANVIVMVFTVAIGLYILNLTRKGTKAVGKSLGIVKGDSVVVRQ